VVLSLKADRFDDWIIFEIQMVRIIVNSFSTQEECLRELRAFESVSGQPRVQEIDVAEIEILRKRKLELSMVSHPVLFKPPEGHHFHLLFQDG
jgi:hypothetical protein